MPMSTYESPSAVLEMDCVDSDVRGWATKDTVAPRTTGVRASGLMTGLHIHAPDTASIVEAMSEQLLFDTPTRGRVKLPTIEHRNSVKRAEAHPENGRDPLPRYENCVSAQPAPALDQAELEKAISESDQRCKRILVRHKMLARRMRNRKERKGRHTKRPDGSQKKSSLLMQEMDNPHRAVKALFSHADPAVHATRLALKAFYRDNRRMRIPVTCGPLGEIHKGQEGATVPVRELIQAFELQYASPARKKRQFFRQLVATERRRHRLKLQSGSVNDEDFSEIAEETDTGEEKPVVECTIAEEPEVEDYFSDEYEDAAEKSESEGGPDPPTTEFGKLSCPGCKGALYATSDHCKWCHVRTKARELRNYYEQYAGSEIFTVLLKVIIFMRQSTMADQGLILLDVAREYGSAEKNAEIIERVANILLPLRDIWHKEAPGEAEDKLQGGEEDETFIGTFHSWISMMRTLGHSRVKTILTALYSLLSIGLAAKCGQTMSMEMIAEAVDTCTRFYKASTPFEAILHGLDNFVSIVRAGCKDGWAGLADWFRPARGLTEMEFLAVELHSACKKYKQMTFGQRAAFKLQLSKAKKWYKENEGWLKSCKIRDFGLSDRGKRIFAAIQDAESIVAHFEHGNTRIKPMTLVFCGGTEVGKSTLQQRAGSIIMSAAYERNIEAHEVPDLTFYWPFNGKFADGLHAGVGCVVIDDMGAKRPQKQPEGDPAIPLIHALSNIAPFFPNNADVADKGKIPCHPPALVISTNINDLNVATTFQQADIIFRRINLFVTVRPKREYSVNGTLSGAATAAWNAQATEQGIDELEDWWEVQVHKFHVSNTFSPVEAGNLPDVKIAGTWEKVFPKPVKRGDDTWAPIKEFWYFLGKESRKHFAAQNEYISQMKVRPIDFTQYWKDDEKAEEEPSEGPAKVVNTGTQPRYTPEKVVKVPQTAKPGFSEQQVLSPKSGARKAPPKGPATDVKFAERRPSQQQQPLRKQQSPRAAAAAGAAAAATGAEGKPVVKSAATTATAPADAQQQPSPQPEQAAEQQQPPPQKQQTEQQADEPMTQNSSSSHPEWMEGLVMGGSSDGCLQAGEPETPLSSNYVMQQFANIFKRKAPEDPASIFDQEGSPQALTKSNVTWSTRIASAQRQFNDLCNAQNASTNDSSSSQGSAEGAGSESGSRCASWTTILRARGDFLQAAGVTGIYTFVMAAMFCFFAFATAVAAHRGYSVCALVAYLVGANDIWVNGWAFVANVTLLANCVSRMRQVLTCPMAQVMPRVMEYNQVAANVIRWCEEHATVLRALMVVAFTLMCAWGYRALSSAYAPKVADEPLEYIPQSAEGPHKNDGIGLYNDFGGQVTKLPASIQDPGVLLDERLTTHDAAVAYAAKIENEYKRRVALEAKMAKNTFVIGLYMSDGTPVHGSAGHAFFVNNTHFVVNAHVVRAKDKAHWLRMSRTPNAGIRGERVDFKLENITFFEVSDDDNVCDRDILVGKISGASFGDRLSNLVPQLPKEPCKSILTVSLLGKTGAACYHGNVTRQISNQALPGGSATIVHASTLASSNATIANTVAGDCGRVYYSGGPNHLSEPFLVLAVHTGVNSVSDSKQKVLLLTPLHGVAQLVTNDLSRQVLQQGNVEPTIHNLGRTLPLPPVHHKSVAWWAMEPEEKLENDVDMTVIGAWTGFRGQDRSRLKQGLLWKHLNLKAVNHAAGEDITDGKVIPDFRGVTAEGSPKIKQAQWIALQQSAAPPAWDESVYQDLKEAANMYLREVEQTKEQWRGQLRKLNIEEAINGIPGLRAFDSLNFSTSAGHPHYVKKNNFFEQRSDGTRQINPELNSSVEALEEGLKAGLVYPVFSSQIKDEVVSETKDAIGKYRVFMMCPVDFTIVTRMYALSCVRVMSLFPYTFGACVGMNATSEQWTQLAHYLGIGQEDCKIFDGDYVNFDKSMRPEVTRVVREFIVDLHRDVFTDEDLTTLDNILKVSYSPVVNYFGTILQFRSINPSGGSLTTQTNCIASNIFIRYSWLKLYSPVVGNIRAADEFRRCVHPMTYGDDLLASVDTRKVPEEFVRKAGLFSCKTMQTALKEIKIQFTDAAKNAPENTAEFSPHDQITFLKRRFVRVECAGYGYDVQYVAPLDKKSICKMLHYTTDRSTVAPLDVLKSTLNSVGVESYFQGRIFFDCIRENVVRALEEYGEANRVYIVVDQFIFPEYDRYQEWYKDTISEASLFEDPYDAPFSDVHPLKRPRDPALMSMPVPKTVPRMLGQCMPVFDVLEGEDSDSDADIAVFTAGTAPQGVRRNDQRCGGLSVPRTCKTLGEKQKMTKKEVAKLQMGEPLTRFFDSGPERSEDLAGALDSSFDAGDMPSHTLTNWLQRPVKIVTKEWAENADLSLTFNPWKLFYSNPDIYAKLQGFCRLRSRLKVKLILSASPYQYSMGIMSYKPLGDDTTTDAFSGGMIRSEGSAMNIFDEEALLSVHTTRPHTYFYPQFSRGCEMTLPFLHYKNWLQLDSSLTELDAMGTMSVFSVRKLRSSTGQPPVQPVTVSIYAWAEDVHLSGPSYVLQSGDPPLYTVRPSLINNLATPGEPGHVEKIALDADNSVECDSVVVGAQGDQMSFTAIMDRDVIVANIDWLSTDASEQVLLLQHVTPCVTWQASRQGDETELNQVALQMTPSAHLATAFNWWHGSITYRFKVIASQMHRGKLAVSYEPDGWDDNWDEQVMMAPRLVTKIWDVANDPEFEFTVPYVASKAYLQTGRMREAVHGTPKILKRPTLPLSSWNAATYKSSHYNGTIALSIINPLTSSDPAADVGIVVTMNASGVSFSEPTELDMPFSMYQLQSGDPEGEGTLANEPDVDVAVGTIAAKEMRAPHVYMGEVVDHLLPLLKRTTKYRSLRLTQFQQTPNDFYTRFPPTLAGTGSPSSISARTIGTTFMQPLLPLGSGTLAEKDPKFIEGVAVGPDDSTSPPGTKIIEGQTERLNTPTAYFSPCYVGWRGSHIYKAKVTKSKSDGPKFSEFSLARSTAPLAVLFNKLWTHMPAITHWSSGDTEPEYTGLGAWAALLAKYRKAGDMANQGSAGMTQTNVEEIPFTEAEFPYYSSYRMMPANPTANYKAAWRPETLSWDHYDAAKWDYSTWSNWCLRSVVQYPNKTSSLTDIDVHPEVQLYHAAGHDFTLMQYLNVPTMYCYVYEGQSGSGVMPAPWWVA